MALGRRRTGKLGPNNRQRMSNWISNVATHDLTSTLNLRKHSPSSGCRMVFLLFLTLGSYEVWGVAKPHPLSCHHPATHRAAHYMAPNTSESSPLHVPPLRGLKKRYEEIHDDEEGAGAGNPQAGTVRWTERKGVLPRREHV